MKDATDLVVWWLSSGANIELIDLVESKTRVLKGIGDEVFDVRSRNELEGVRVKQKKVVIDPQPWARRFLRAEREKGIWWTCVVRRSGKRSVGMFAFYVEPWVSGDEVDELVPRGVWQLDRDGELEARVRRELEKLDAGLARNAQVSEVIAALEVEAYDRKAARALGYDVELGGDEDPEWIKVGREWLNLENGMFNWKTGELREWRREDWSKVRIPCRWPLTEEETREWVELVSGEVSGEVSGRSGEVWVRSQEWVERKLREAGFGEWLDRLEQWVPDEKSRWFLQEYFGYCLIPEAASRTVVFLYGVGSNGKSRVTEALKSLVGGRNCLEQPLESLVEGRFARVGLDGKLVNLCGEIEGRLLRGTAVVKEIVGGGNVTAEVKFGPAVSFRSTVRLVFATNNLPRVEDLSEGWFSRVRIVEFPRKFEANPGFQLWFDDWVRERRDWLLLWAVEGLRRYKIRGVFTESEKMRSAVEEYRGRADTVTWFVQEVLEKKEERGAYLPVRVVWELFKAVCKSANRQPCSEPEFKRRLKELGVKIEPRRVRFSGEDPRKNTPCLIGYGVNEVYHDVYDDVVREMAAEIQARLWRKASQRGAGFVVEEGETESGGVVVPLPARGEE